MTVPRRWIDEDATQAERRLLLSARDDAPTAGSRDKLFAALGVGGATALGVAAAAAAELPNAATLAVGGVAALGKAAPSSAGVTALVLMKWVGVGAVAGLVSTGTLTAISQRAASARPAPAAAVATIQAPARIAAAPALPSIEEPVPPPVELPAIETTEPEPTPEPPSASTAKGRPFRPSKPAQQATPNVGKEVTTLDRAREALAAGDAPRALKALGQHESEFASGALGPEAEVLRIEALLARGEHNSAAVMARGFLFTHRSSPHLGRVRALLARAKAADAPPGASD